MTWTLTEKSLTASSKSDRCPGGSLTVTKQLLPPDDPGRFNLKIDGDVAGGASEVGNGGTTGTIAVSSGKHTVGESAASGTSLDDYRVQIVCRASGGDGDVVAQGSGTSLSVQVSKGDAIVCTITNEATEDAKSVSPVLDCVVFDNGAPSFADWGYSNTSGVPVVVPVGNANHFSPSPANRNQPTGFQAGSYVGVFQTAFGAGEAALTWTLAGHSVTANAGSPRCAATVEIQKLVEPASDPGVFNLQINGQTLASGGNGTTTGPITVGVGEGTVTETAGTGTALADYDSSVVVHAERDRGGLGSRREGRRSRRDGRRRRVQVHEREEGDSDTADASHTHASHTDTARADAAAAAASTDPRPEAPARSRGGQDREAAAVSVGGRITWTMTVTNRSAVTAADVNGLKVNDPRSFRTKLISLTSSQGTCRPYACNLGRLAPGASATVVAVTRALRVGPVVDVVRVGSEEIESNYRNNIASALVRVIGPLRPPTLPTVCRTLTAAPRLLRPGERRSSC